jgi:oxalate decarboxylase/phosphoglucose isomerase-like protein (cupin superfamily)
MATAASPQSTPKAAPASPTRPRAISGISQSDTLTPCRASGRTGANFQSSVPGPLAADQEAVKSPKGPPPNPFTYSLKRGPIARRTQGGMAQIADSRDFKASTTIAAALVTVHLGGMREMHWHPNADEWKYYVKGSAQMTVFNTGPKAVTNNFSPATSVTFRRTSVITSRTSAIPI